MRVIYLSQLDGHDYVLTRGKARPSARDGLEPVLGLPVAARTLTAALVQQPRALAALLEGDTRWTRDAPSSALIEQAAAAVTAELARTGGGRFRLWRARRDPVRLDPIVLPRPETPEPPAPPYTPPPEPEPSSHWLELELIDAEELPAPKVAYELMLPDGDHRLGNFDGEGKVAIDGIGESGHCKLRLPDIDREGPILSRPIADADLKLPAIPYLREFLSLPVDAKHLLRLPPEPSGAHFIEFDDVFFSFNSTALLPETKDHTPPVNAEGEPLTGLNLVMAVLQYSEQFDSQKLLLVLGHTDTMGSDADNVELSKLRAQVVHALIVGDREAFKEAVDAPHISNEETKAKVLIPDKNFVLDWVAEHTDWPCSLAENFNSHWAATKKFQEHYNEHGAEFGGSDELSVDSDFGKQTWAAVFDIYQDHIARALELSHEQLDAKQSALHWAAPQAQHVGCGEFHPIDSLGKDGFRSANNRRVEVTFFDPGELPALECFAGGCAERSCKLFDPWLFPRTPLPISWKALWKVSWDRPSEPAKMGESRDIILKAPKLAEGSAVEIEVEIEVKGERSVIATLETEAVDQGARVSFSGWYDPELVTHEEALLELDEDFPPVRFHVRARTEEREVEGRRPLPYADTLHAEIQHELVASVYESDTVYGSDCLIHSPWGVKQAEIDEHGLLYVENLPPGGVMVTIDDDPYFPS